MARASGRSRGNIEALPSGGFRVRVYAGTDPLTKRPHYLRETVPAGPGASREAERVKTRLLTQVDERKNPRTRATMGELIDRWLEVVDIEVSTKRGYIQKINKHVRPLLGAQQVAKIDAEVLDSFYARLRRCRDHCQGPPYVQHRTTHPHECDEHESDACEPPRLDSCRACRRKCQPHACKGLADSSIRQIHWIISGAFNTAVRWGWLGINPADSAAPPSSPHPNPQPPSADEAARLVNEAWKRDPDWGALVWTAMTSGARRGEVCALRIRHFDDANGVLTVQSALYKGDDGQWHEKDTKPHQQRRVVVDNETHEVIREQISRLQERADDLETDLSPDSYLFSAAPDSSSPRNPDSVTQRYERMADRLGIDTTIHRLRHYSATELILAGVNIRAVAGRLGHSGGGATTLRVYAAWTSEADQRAANALAGRMPQRPKSN